MSHSSCLRCLLVLCLALLLIVAGCGPRLEPIPTPEPITLRVAYRQHTVELQGLFERFQEQYPWITVQAVETERWGDLQTLVRAGNADIVRDRRDILELAGEGLIRTLDDIQLGDWAGIREDYFRGAWEGLSVDGQQWGIPAGLDMLVTYVNLDQSQALNVRLPGEDWTLFEFLDLTMGLNYPLGLPQSSTRLFGFCTTPESVDPVLFVYLHGGGIVDDINSPKEPTLDNPRTVEAAQWYADLYTRHGLAPDPEMIRTTFRMGGIYEAAVRGSCGVWVGMYSQRGGLDTPFHWPFNWRMLPMPRDRAPFNLGDVEGYFITKQCAHPREALMLLRFLSDHSEAAGQMMPPRRSQVESEDYELVVGEEAAELAGSFGERSVLMVPAQSAAELEQVAGAFFQAIQLMIKEGVSAAEALDAAQQQARMAFKAAP
jgi:ABC-type glycerol-3-phosphate transport system substrate-binding protein